MKIDGIDYNVTLCKEMSKEKFIETMNKHVAHLPKEEREEYLSEIYDLIKWSVGENSQT